MRSHYAIRLTPLFAFTLFFFSACTHEIPFAGSTGNSTPSTSNACSTDSMYFVNTVQPLLNTSCALTGCHDASSHREGVELTSYAKVLATGGIRPGDPMNSELYQLIARTDNKRMPPPPYAAFTSTQKNIIYKWIEQGAKNNSCNACDTTIFTYSGAINPLINTYCKGCHNPSSLGGGIDLSTYTGVKTQALNGKLMGTITHAAGYLPMPKGGTKWSDCKIKQVQQWITAGTPNN